MKHTPANWRRWTGLVLASGLLVSPLSAAPPAASPPPNNAGASQGGDIDIGLGEDMAINVEVENPDRPRFEKAKAAMAAEDYASASVVFHDLLNNPKAKEFHQESEYLLAKSLYRLGYYHSALGAFTKLLAKGEKHKFYKTSQEWLFFISRKTADQGVVVEEIARYAAEHLPEKYADEFHFLLAKLFFAKAADDELIKQEQKANEPPPEPEAPSPEKSPSKQPKSDEDDMDFNADDLGSGGDDGMDFGLDDLEETPKKKGKGKDKAPPKAVKPEASPSKSDKKAKDLGKKPAPQPTFGDEEDSITVEPAKTPPKAAPVAPKPAPEAAPEASGGAKRPALFADKKEALDKCVDHASQVRPESKLYLKAVYLKAVCHYELQDFEKAVTGFREVIKLTHPKTGKFKTSTKLREEAFFSLARTHYSFQQFRASIFYYNKISRDSANWLDALFESSWAYFRLADYEKALGNLVTMHAPFFVNEYFPESLILKAVTYYENCRYPEAIGILGEFEQQYGALRDELDRLTKDAKTAEDYYALLKKLEKTSNASALTTRLVKLAKTDKNLQLMAASAGELEAEEKKISGAGGSLKGSPLTASLLEGVEKRREQLTAQAGAVARAKLEGERDELKSLSSQLFRIKFEITKREKEGLEASLRGEKQGTALGGYRYTAAVADDEEYWPFDGEYWRDELGTYQYTLSKGCRQ